MIYLLGAGPMAIEYSKVLNALGRDFRVIGRGRKSAENFERLTGKTVLGDSLDGFNFSEKDFVINAVSHINLFVTTRQLLNSGAKQILLEKPGAILFSELEELNDLAAHKEAHVYIAYNRRFLQSIQKTRDLCARDGGIEFIEFEFSEWLDAGRKVLKPTEVHRTWFMANSSHVLDLALFLGGEIAELESSFFETVQLGDQDVPSIYLGHGKTVADIPISYKALWDAPGRWGLTVYSKKRKYILYPLEKLFVQERNEISISEYELNDDGYSNLKPGLLMQVKNFLNQKIDDLIGIQTHVKRIEMYSQISGIQDKC